MSFKITGANHGQAATVSGEFELHPSLNIVAQIRHRTTFHPTMKKPDPDQFAKAVLWQLAGVRSELATARANIEMIQAKLGMPSSEKFVEECFARDAESQM